MSRKVLKQLKVLFVEDEDIIRKKTVSSLEYIVSEVCEASNGIEALEKCKKLYSRFNYYRFTNARYEWC